MTSSRRTILLGIAAVVIAGIVAIVLSSSGSDTPETAPVADGPPAPTTEFAFFDGTTATLAHYEGQPLVINFWASWCPSCVAEMSAAFRPVQERLGDEVAFVGFNIQDERSHALTLVDQTGVLFDLAEDPIGELYTELGGIGMPFTVFVSPDGIVVHEHNGPVTEAQLEDLISEHLNA